MATKRKKKQPVSMLQVAQRELAWLLYITEGYKSNIAGALTYNAYTLDARVLAMMEKLHVKACNTADELRNKLQNLPQEF